MSHRVEPYRTGSTVGSDPTACWRHMIPYASTVRVHGYISSRQQDTKPVLPCHAISKPETHSESAAVAANVCPSGADICIYTLYIYIHIHTHISLYLYISLSLCVYIYIYTYVEAWTWASGAELSPNRPLLLFYTPCRGLRRGLCPRRCPHISLSIYNHNIYIYIYIKLSLSLSIYIYIYIYIYVSLARPRPVFSEGAGSVTPLLILIAIVVVIG